MKIAIGSDHRGIDCKQQVIALLTELGHDVLDLGTKTHVSVDYPDIAIPVASQVAGGEVERGVLICATGHGMCIAANKVDGVRAANCRDTVDAEMSRRHNNANVLCMPADLLGEDTIDRLVRIWLDTDFEQGRHARRMDKITAYERQS